MRANWQLIRRQFNSQSVISCKNILWTGVSLPPIADWLLLDRSLFFHIFTCHKDRFINDLWMLTCAFYIFSSYSYPYSYMPNPTGSRMFIIQSMLWTQKPVSRHWYRSSRWMFLFWIIWWIILTAHSSSMRGGLPCRSKALGSTIRGWFRFWFAARIVYEYFRWVCTIRSFL